MEAPSGGSRGNGTRFQHDLSTGRGGYGMSSCLHFSDDPDYEAKMSKLKEEYEMKHPPRVGPPSGEVYWVDKMRVEENNSIKKRDEANQVFLNHQQKELAEAREENADNQRSFLIPPDLTSASSVHGMTVDTLRAFAKEVGRSDLIPCLEGISDVKLAELLKWEPGENGSLMRSK